MFNEDLLFLNVWLKEDQMILTDLGEEDFFQRPYILFCKETIHY